MGPRLINWPRLLTDLVDARRDTPWAWGSHDCAMLAWDAVRVISDIDHGAWIRGRYKTARGAMTLLRAYLAQRGLQRPDDTLEAVLDTLMAEAGVAAVDPTNAPRGSLAIAEVERPPFGCAVGVVIGGGRVAFAVDPGVVFIPAERCLRAWET